MNQRKQELKSNELAGWLEQQLAGSSQLLKPLLAVAAILLVVVLTVYGIRTQRDRAAGSGWAAFLQAGSDNAALRDVAKQHSGTNIELWALASRAANEIQGAATQLHLDRQNAAEAVQSAIEDLEKVLAETEDQKGSLVRVNALFGLGQAHELNFDIDKAKQYYSQLILEAPQAALAGVAKNRSERLGEDEVRQFYTWYAKQEPPRPGSSPPPGSVPDVSNVPDLPSDLQTLPSFPDLSIPQPAAPQPPAPQPPAPSESQADEDPADDEGAEKEADKDPADKDPADKDPADKDPADKDPADKDPADKDPADEDPADKDPADSDKAS